MVLLALLLLAQVTASVVMPRGDALTIASDYIQGLLLLIATAAFLPNTFAARNPNRRTRAFWILIFGGMFFWLCYQGMWNYFEVFKRQEVPNPFTGDIVLFLHLVPMMAGLALLPHLDEDERDARIRTLDFALLLIWWVFLYVYAVIPWQTVHVNEIAYSNNFNSTYLTEKMVLLVALVFLTYHAQAGWRLLYAQLLGASALYASSSYVANYAIAHQTYYSGSIYDIPLAASMAWMAIIGKFGAGPPPLPFKNSPPLFGVLVTLPPMLGYSDLLSASEMPPPEQSVAATIAAQVRRTRTLVASLLTFVRQAPAKMAAVDVNSILHTAIRLLAPQLEVQATDFRLELGSALPPVLADSNQLLHVFLHLAGQISARPHSEQTVALHVRTWHEGYFISVDFTSEASSPSTSYQPLQSSDSGPQRSTLSLGACSRIVTEHGGRILVQQSPEGFSAFRVELPVSVKSAVHPQLATIPNPALAGS